MLVRCAHCGAPRDHVPGQRVEPCRYCGQTGLEDPNPDDDLTLEPSRCPSCGHALFGGQARQTIVYGCIQCGGVWLDLATSQAMVAAPDLEIVEMSRRAKQNARTFGKDAKVPRGCPVCRSAMCMTPIHDRVTVDACPEHGTWFDAGELERVIELLVAPSASAKPRGPATRPHPPVTQYELDQFRAALRTPTEADQELAQGLGLGLLGVLAVAAGAAAAGARS